MGERGKKRELIAKPFFPSIPIQTHCSKLTIPLTISKWLPYQNYQNRAHAITKIPTK